ncbi:MAG: regulatory protein TetR [Paenibacillaceae bacterium]|jgi:AcrR family transcriptional regulator|nr:regulatory protein TetR [Paenibacillaceae bacterium]
MKKTARQLQKEQTKVALVQAAYEVFSTRGFQATRMADIAKAAGVSHGTVFLHFSTQEQLVAEVIEAYCGEIVQETHQSASPPLSLREFLDAHIAAIIRHEAFYTRLVIENRLLPQEARDAWIGLQSAVSFHFSQALERGPEGAGAEVPLSLLFNMWLGLVHYYLGNGDLFAPEGGVLRRHGPTLTENYMKLIQERR